MMNDKEKNERVAILKENTKSILRNLDEILKDSLTDKQKNALISINNSIKNIEEAFGIDNVTKKQIEVWTSVLNKLAKNKK